VHSTLSNQLDLAEKPMFSTDRSQNGCHQQAVYRASNCTGFRAVCLSLLSVLCIALVSACSNLAGPEYVRPEIPEKEQWSELSGREITTSEIIRPDWWKGFNDPYLNELIQKAIDEGLDLKIAAARLDKAGIGLEQERFPLTPELTFGPSDRISRSKVEGGDVSTTRQTERLGAGLTWEIDIWGKIRKGVEASEAGYKATEMDWRAAYLTLVSSVAERYFQIRLFDEQIQHQTAAEAQNRDLLDIYEAQYNEGLIAKTQILKQKSELNSLKKQLLDLQRSRTESELKLATLLGVPAGDLSVPAGDLRESISLIEIPAILPADLLSRRPDVLAAEYNVLRAHHLLGKARLARLPTFSLSASATTGRSLSSSLLNAWTFGLTQSFAPMFDRNLKIDVRSSEADVGISIEQYRKAVLTAFEETEIALLNLKSRQEQMQELEEQVSHLSVVQGVQQSRLKEGLLSQLEVFETERTLLAAKQGILTQYQQLLSDTVTLYKALGGGWPAEDVAGQFTPAREPEPSSDYATE
jgi:multidrug efflux system outer membrane protein